MAAMLANRERANLLRKSKSSNSVSARYHTTANEPQIPDMIIPNLYLCDMSTARAVLQPSFAGQGRPKIRYILSVLDNSISQPRPKAVNVDKFVQKLIILDDTPYADLLAKLSEACDWIEDALARGDGGVLVHCQLGQSRSASIIIAYLMRNQGLDYQKALEKVKYRRSRVRPNSGFQDQLQLWQSMQYNICELEDGQLFRKAQYLKWKENNKSHLQQLSMS